MTASRASMSSMRKKLKLVPQTHHQLDQQINEIKRMLNAFIKTLAAG